MKIYLLFDVIVISYEEYVTVKVRLLWPYRYSYGLFRTQAYGNGKLLKAPRGKYLYYYNANLYLLKNLPTAKNL